MSQIADEQSQWKSVYKLGGWISLLFILYSLVTMILLVVIGGQPETAAEAFEMLQENRLIALLRLDILTLFVVPFYYVIFLGIYVALRKTNLGYASLATLISCAGVTLVLATPSVFLWLSLNDKFTAATTDIQRDEFLAAGEAILASDMWHGSGAIIGAIVVADIPRFYWEEVQQVPDLMGPIINPEDLWINEPLFPVMPEIIVTHPGVDVILPREIIGNAVARVGLLQSRDLVMRVISELGVTPVIHTLARAGVGAPLETTVIPLITHMTSGTHGFMRMSRAMAIGATFDTAYFFHVTS